MDTISMPIQYTQNELTPRQSYFKEKLNLPTWIFQRPVPVICHSPDMTVIEEVK